MAREYDSQIRANIMQPRRQHLIETARRLFNRHGYHATGIDLILTESGVSKATMYKYFKSKEALILTVLQLRHEELIEEFSNAMANARAANKSPTLALFDTMHAWFNSPDFFGCNFINASAEYSDADDPIHRLAAEHKDAVVQLIVDSLDSGSKKIRTRLAEEVSMLAEGAIVRAHIQGDRNAAKIARRAAASLLEAHS